MAVRFNEDYDAFERECSRCREWWPADKEFFFSGGHGALMTICKACYLQRRYPNGRSAMHYQERRMEVKIAN
jgi:RNase P subunit RPR2